MRGSLGRERMPFGLTATTVAVTCRSFHMTLPWPAPSVCRIFPSGSVRTTTSGNFSPGPMPGPFGRLAWMEAIGVLSRKTFHPILTCRRVQPLRPSSEEMKVINNAGRKRFLQDTKARDLKLLMIGLHEACDIEF